MNRRAASVVAISAILASAAFAQTAFETASVRKVTGPQKARMQMTGGPGTSSPGRISYVSVNLTTLLMRAWDLRQFQLVTPAWMTDELYDIAATLPPGTDESQFRTMLGGLLNERFHMVSHRENKEISALGLVVSKSGPKLKPAALAAAPAGKIAVFPIGDTLRAVGRSASLSALTDFLTLYLKRPVFDETDLPGSYDIDVTFQSADNISGSDSPPGDSLYSVLKTQCGLELQSRKRAVDVLVVDRADKVPTEN